jgi:hypothetical protein
MFVMNAKKGANQLLWIMITLFIAAALMLMVYNLVHKSANDASKGNIKTIECYGVSGDKGSCVAAPADCVDGVIVNIKGCEGATPLCCISAPEEIVP